MSIMALVKIVKLIESWFIFGIQHTHEHAHFNEGTWLMKTLDESNRIANIYIYIYRIKHVELSIQSWTSTKRYIATKWNENGKEIASDMHTHTHSIYTQTQTYIYTKNKKNECDKSDWVALNKWPVKINNYIGCVHE